MDAQQIRTWIGDLIFEEIARKGPRGKEGSTPHFAAKIPAQPEADWVNSVSYTGNDLWVHFVSGKKFVVTVTEQGTS